MGIIKAVFGAIGGSLADQWQEVIEPDDMSDLTVFTKGVFVQKENKRSSNTRGTADIISDGSIIHIYDNQFMLLVDGGKIIDYSAEPGYYKVDNATVPSLFNGQLGDSVKESFSRIKYGGAPSSKQQVFYINLQEIKGIKFGTQSPINYFDNFYNSELFLRAHGSYSIKITDPLKFYSEAIPRNSIRINIEDINEQYINEFMEALQSAINQMSADGVRISYVASKGRELSKYMNTILDEEWRNLRGMEIQSVGIASITYDEESQKLIIMRNQGAMLENPGVREGYVQGAMARGIEAAGSNEGGAMAGFMGVGIGLNAGGNIAGAFSQSNQSQMQQQAAQSAQQQNTAPAGNNGWKCSCGHMNNQSDKFCSECGAVQQNNATDGWKCSCGHMNSQSAKFCPECGKAQVIAVCSKCGYKPDGDIPKFCPKCGTKF